MSRERGLLSTSTLAAIEAGMSELLKGNEMANLLEQFGFEPPAVLSAMSSKLKTARAYLRKADWNQHETVDRVLSMLSHLRATIASRVDREGNDLGKSPAAQRIFDALSGNEGITWDGTRLCLPPSAAIDQIARAVATFGIAELDQEIRRITQNVNHDPADAITSARALVESACRHILADHGEEPSAGAELSELVNSVVERLQLLPPDTSEANKGREAVRKVVRSLRAALDGLVELRGLYGDPHGKGPGYKGIEPRHARLAATLAGGVAVFFMETHERRKG